MATRASKTASRSAPVEIFSTDPEVQALKGIIGGLKQMRRKHFTTIHLKVLCAVAMLCRVMKDRGFPRVREISSQIDLAPAEFHSELRELVENRFLHEVIPTYGDVEDNSTYKLGVMGGQCVKRMLRR